MRWWTTGLFALLVASLSGSSRPALADFQSGNSLLSRCRSDASLADRQYCLGYVTGAADFAIQDERNNKAMDKVCWINIPDGVTSGQLLEILVKYLREHPERLHYQGGYLIIEAFHQAFPCK
jgi:hypothetical protein